MAFIDAVKISGVSYVHSELGTATRDGSQAQGRSQGPKQSVNISEETLRKLVRQKLTRAVGSKLSYDRKGAFDDESQAGSLFSAKA